MNNNPTIIIEEEIENDETLWEGKPETTLSASVVLQLPLSHMLC